MQEMKDFIPAWYIEFTDPETGEPLHRKATDKDFELLDRFIQVLDHVGFKYEKAEQIARRLINVMEK